MLCQSPELDSPSKGRLSKFARDVVSNEKQQNSPGWIMQICRDIDDLRQWRSNVRGKVALVPTMGALHEGHLSLMRQAREAAGADDGQVVVSIFVNPAQFGPEEDFARYPRDFERDEKLCREVGVDLIFYPDVEKMYPRDFRSWVEVEELTEVLEGAIRPGHFRGVTTIVLKLFNLVQPDAAVFGWKDAQQFIVLRRMVEDLNLPLEMIGCEIVREADQLALSSRNVYLSEEQRAEAPLLYRSLQLARSLFEANPEISSADIQAQMRALIENESSGAIDYITVVSQGSLQQLDRIAVGDTLIALAVRFGKTRLLDNIRL